MFLQRGTIMARAGIQRATMSIVSSCREAGNVYRGFSRFARAVDCDEPAESFTGEKNYCKEDSLTWVPHPRSGIYYPEGHERVMVDVPEGAASLGGRTLWLRNDDGLEKPDPENDGHSVSGLTYVKESNTAVRNSS